MNCAKLSLVVLAVAFLAPTYVSAGVVHKWHDAEGVMQFSDTPPASDDFHVSTIEFNAEEPRDGREADYYSIINQWQRLNAERLENEQLKLQKARLRAEERSILSSTISRSVVRPVHLGYPYHAVRSVFHRFGFQRRNLIAGGHSARPMQRNGARRSATNGRRLQQNR